jgi:hypothetical protein
MDIIDMHNPNRVKRNPDSVEILLSSGNFIQDEFVISKVELRLYNEQIDDTLGVYSLITSFVETDKGSVEMIYDEGFRGLNSLSRASSFLISNLGISGLILRSVIVLREKHPNNTIFCILRKHLIQLIFCLKL